MDASDAQDERVAGGRAKARGPDLPTLRSSFARRFGKATGAIKPGTPGRARHKP